MKRTLTIVASAALAICAFAPAAVAQNDTPNPKQVANTFCHDQKKAMKAETGDNQAFKELYGGKRAMQTCKRQNQGEAEAAVENAAQECDTERETMGEEAFAQQYGTNANGKNAYGKCVSGKAKEQSEETAEETANAAQECDSERETMGEDAFRDQYGTNKNGKNAFGKCVSQKAQEQEEEEEPTPPTS